MLSAIRVHFGMVLQISFQMCKHNLVKSVNGARTRASYPTIKDSSVYYCESIAETYVQEEFDRGLNM